MCDREKQEREICRKHNNYDVDDEKKQSKQGKALIEDNYVMCHVFAICEIRSECDMKWRDEHVAG